MLEKEFILEQKHIDNGIRFDPTECMLALAIKDAFPSVFKVIVGGHVAIYLTPDKSIRLHIPIETAMLRKAFDLGRTIVPCKFKLTGDFSLLEEK